MLASLFGNRRALIILIKDYVCGVMWQRQCEAVTKKEDVVKGGGKFYLLLFIYFNV